MTTQGVGGKAGSNGISLRGGEAVRRFVVNANDSGLTARLTAKSIKRRIMPGYRRDLPVRTGELASRVVIRVRGNRVELRGISYGKYVKWRPDQERDYKSPVSLFFEHFERQHRRVAQDIVRGLL